jgi:2-C-methyl-D-erythritol 4-phosphate cytidylyltransferase
LIDDFFINKIINSLNDYKIVLTGIKAVDTLLKVDIIKSNNNILKRDNIYCLHTPQCFNLKNIIDAYTKTSKFKKQFSDDSSVYLNIYTDDRIKIIKSSFKNFKITYNEDINLFKKFL